MIDQYLIPFVLFGSLILLLFVFVIGAFIIIQKQKQQRAIIERRETEQLYKNQMLNVRLEVQEHSLAMVSREIHDNIGQVLSIVRMQLFNTSRVGSLDLAKSQVTTSIEMLGTAINDLRNLSHMLNGDMVNRLGIINAIEQELSNVNSTYPAKGSLSVYGEEMTLSPEKELLVFRIVQQAIGNIHRHANATFFKIELHYDTPVIEMIITDNGDGFNKEQLAKASGIGLMNITERAKMLGGEVFFKNNEEGGACLQLKFKI